MTARIWTDVPPELLDEPGRIVDKHISFLFEAEQIGGHVHVKVRAAARHPSCQVNHSRGLCGTLVMDPLEWLMLRAALASCEVLGPTWVLDDETHRGQIIAGAGHPALVEVETDWGEHKFIEIQDQTA